ncbi:MAG: GGDEF domain-containing protein, partial [Tumebacillaceae bacterium]
MKVSEIRKIEFPINERLRKRQFWQATILIVIGAIVSFGLIFAVLYMMEIGRVSQWFGWSWGPKPDGENIALRALIINAVQLSVLFYRTLFRGYDLVTDRERMRLYVIFAYLASLSWAALLLKYFHGPTIDKVNQIVGLIGLTGIPLTIYSIVLLVQLYQKVENRLKREKELSEQYYEQLITDQLTGLPNRILFQEHLTAALQAARQNKTRLAVLFIDLDRFKYINDTLGHKVGDLLLMQVVERLLSCLRDDEALYRLGGDEFIIVEEHTPDKQQAVELAKKILATVDTPYLIEGHELFISTSIGISW